jgi:hypothetical protein
MGMEFYGDSYRGNDCSSLVPSPTSLSTAIEASIIALAA